MIIIKLAVMMNIGKQDDLGAIDYIVLSESDKDALTLA